MKLSVVLLCGLLPAAESYKQPPKPVLDVLNAPAPPQARINPTHTHLLLLEVRRYPPIAEVAQPMLRLAGLRINPRNNGPHLPQTFTGITLKRIADGQTIAVTLPANARLSAPQWSPDGKQFAFTHSTRDSIELWIADTETGKARSIAGLRVNAALGDPIEWMPDSLHLLVKAVPASRGKVPEPPEVPQGPNIQESKGRAAPVRTYQDLLSSEFDKELFDYYATAQWMRVDSRSGKAVAAGPPGVFSGLQPSPDGKLLLVSEVKRPYSLLHPYRSFPHEIQAWDAEGKLVKKLFSLPLQDSVPIDGVPTGPRNVSWRPDEPASVTWVEALDDGNPKKKAPNRDRLMSWKAPFSGTPAEWTRTEHRSRGVDWGKGFALVGDYERDRRWIRTFYVDLKDKGASPRLLFSRSMQDRYGDPGSPVEETTATGHRMLLQDGDDIFLDGNGASPDGAHPFLDRYNLKTGEKKRIFQSGKDRYEQVFAVLANDGSKWITVRESQSEPPNYFVKTSTGESRPLTAFEDPVPQIRKIEKRLIKYKRPDGVDLSFTLYLPPDYKEGTRLPTVVWAYPREYVEASTAGQFGGSTDRFTTITGTSHLFFLLAGYAVLDDAAMPVVGPPETVNNTYVEQIVASAKAAIDKAAELGVTDPKRVGVGGHSYGAFMTANLLAHSDLFQAGVARSGAYNRTLTPFGFQSERRTLWEAAPIYLKMSPFMVADKINEPILLIHGEADNNAGTFPIQSDRMYQAVRGNGGKVRLVFLPHESHGYSARESVEHTLAEMIEWFDKYVKNAGTSSTPGAPSTQ